MTDDNRGVVNVSRREWDMSEWEEKARERARAEREADSAKDARGSGRNRSTAVVVRAPLKHREKEIALESRLGKYTLISSSTPLSQQGGYWCNICECKLADSNTYLDHINGKKT